MNGVVRAWVSVWVSVWVRGQFLKPVSYWSEFIAVAVEGMAR